VRIIAFQLENYRRFIQLSLLVIRSDMVAARGKWLGTNLYRKVTATYRNRFHCCQTFSTFVKKIKLLKYFKS